MPPIDTSAAGFPVEFAVSFWIVLQLVTILLAGIIWGCACCGKKSKKKSVPPPVKTPRIPTVMGTDPRYQTLRETDADFVASIKSPKDQVKPKHHKENKAREKDRHDRRHDSPHALPADHPQRIEPPAYPHHRSPRESPQADLKRRHEPPSPGDHHEKDLQKEKEREAAIAEVKRFMEIKKTKEMADTQRREAIKDQQERDRMWRQQHRQMWGRKQHPPPEEQFRPRSPRGTLGEVEEGIKVESPVVHAVDQFGVHPESSSGGGGGSGGTKPTSDKPASASSRATLSRRAGSQPLLWTPATSVQGVKAPSLRPHEKPPSPGPGAAIPPSLRPGLPPAPSPVPGMKPSIPGPGAAIPPSLRPGLPPAPPVAPMPKEQPRKELPKAQPRKEVPKEQGVVRSHLL